MRKMRPLLRFWAWPGLLGLIVAWPAGLAGCGREMKGYTGPVLAPADLGLSEAVCPAEGFRIIRDQPSTGRFPGAMAVIRLEPAENPGPEDPRWRVGTLLEEQGAYWNSLFNATPEIRELMILNRRTPWVRGAGIEALAATAQRLSARLCLVYGPAQAQPEEAALMGNLLDSQTGESLACVSATATPADFEAARPDRQSGDQRHRDVEYLAARKFETLVKQCVIELIRRDATPTTTRPSPWQGMERPEKPTIYVIPGAAGR